MRANAGLLGLFIISTAVFLAIFGGLTSAVLPWWFVAVLFSPPLLIAVGGRWPMVAMLVALLFAFGMIPLGGPFFADLIVVSFVVFVLATRWREIPAVWDRYRPHWILLLALLAWGAAMTFYGKVYLKNNIAYVYQEAMTLAYWGMMAAVALITNDDKKSRFTLYTLITVAVLLSLLSLAQSVTGMRLSISGAARVDSAEATIGGIEGLARSGVPGITLIMFTFLLAMANVLRSTGRIWLWWFVLLVTAGALFVSFGRALWGVMALSVLIVTVLAGRRAIFRMSTWGVLVLALIISAAWFLKPDAIEGVVERITSVKSEGSSQTSLGWRITENYFAVRSFESAPLMGIGLGGEYKPRLVDARMFSAQTHYIHNGYLYILVKTGLIGLFFYLLFYLYLMKDLFKEWRQQAANRNAHIALGTVMLATLMLNVTQPELMTGPSVICFAVLMPCILVGRRVLGKTRTAPPAATAAPSSDRPAPAHP